MRGCTGPRTAKRANVAGNLPHVSSYRWLSVIHSKQRACSWLKMRETQPISSVNFHFPIMSCSREKIPGSPRFSILQAEPGNEAHFSPSPSLILSLPLPSLSLISSLPLPLSYPHPSPSLPLPSLFPHLSLISSLLLPLSYPHPSLSLPPSLPPSPPHLT